MDIYEELGVRKVINGLATVTILGGSIMPPEVVSAMAQAAQHFVDIDELQAKVGQELARLTRNEAAFVSCGAAAGLALITAACITGLDPQKRDRLPYTDGLANEILIHKCWRVGYDFAIRQAGGRIIEVGDAHGATPEQLEAAISPHTVAIFYFYNSSKMGGHVPLNQAIEIAKRHGIPLIIDAAAQIPPAENLWRFTAMGADLVLFSGGKGLRGPQSSGLILGRKDLIEACAFNAGPRAFIGRPMKVGKEEIVGLLAAVKWTLAQDEQALLQDYEDQVAFAIETCAALSHVSACRNFPSEAGQPMPRAEIILDEESLGITRDQLLARLRAGVPSIALAAAGPNSVFINPQTLQAGEIKIICERIRALLA